MEDWKEFKYFNDNFARPHPMARAPLIAPARPITCALACACWYSRLSCFLKILPYFFLQIYASEESTLHMKHAKKYCINFLTMKVMILETHRLWQSLFFSHRKSGVTLPQQLFPVWSDFLSLEEQTWSWTRRYQFQQNKFGQHLNWKFK